MIEKNLGNVERLVRLAGGVLPVSEQGVVNSVIIRVEKVLIIVNPMSSSC